MLRHVLGDYLSNIQKERVFDAPFLALLSAMGFSDVNLTHGIMEKGKDFIAKKDGEQWVFQTKKGDINVGDLNNGVHGQLLAAATTDHHHPAFDRNLPRRVVLVLTGIETQPAADQLHSLSAHLVSNCNCLPIESWNRDKLTELLFAYGLEGVRASNPSASDLKAQGKFLTLYGSIAQGNLILADIEEYSREWLNNQAFLSERILLGSLEASILAGKCENCGLLYECFQCNLAALRMCMLEMFRAEEQLHEAQMLHLCEKQMEIVLGAAESFVDSVWEPWIATGRRFDRLISSPSVFATYPMHCCRVIEALGLIALSDDEVKSNLAHDRLLEFIDSEAGVGHPISDRYMISIAVAVLALLKFGKEDKALHMIKRATIWLCDRNENGAGLAHIDATVEQELEQLLGYPFPGLGVVHEHSSLLASALVDLSAFIGDKEFYSDVVNDLKLFKIIPEYYQTSDSLGQFLIDHDEVTQYPGIEFTDVLAEGYSPYAATEPPVFRLFDRLGFAAYMSLSLFLRDRYFPSLWGKQSP